MHDSWHNREAVQAGSVDTYMKMFKPVNTRV
jgi:hypothetical protein